MTDDDRCILLVDDNDRLRPRLVRAFADRGLRAHGAASPSDALLQVRRGLRPELAVVDLRMPGGSGLDLIGDLRALLPDLKVVMLTGYGSIPTAVEAVRRGAVDYLAKPADANQILAAFEQGGVDLGADPDYAPPSLARAEWEHIQRVLEDCDGNISEAARKLGVHRRTLQRKLNRYPPLS